MSRFYEKEIHSKIREFRVFSEDIRGVERNILLKILELAYLIRTFETTILDLKEKDLVYGPVHSSIGQEAIAAGCGVALTKTDIIGSTHRAHHHFLGKALPFYYPDSYTPEQDEFSKDMQICVQRTLHEIMGLKDGWCRGRGGSMHLRNQEAGIIGTNAIVGGGIALTTGAAWAQKLHNKKNISVAFLGDGAVNQGILLESVNMAKLLNIPVIYFIENNLYAVGTKTDKSSSTEDIAQRALGFGIDGIIVNGMDPVTIYLLIMKIKKEMAEFSGPYFVEAKTYRFFHHAGKLPGSSFGYRNKSEEEQWLKKDPVICFPETLKKLNLLSPDEDEFIKDKVERSVQLALSTVLGKKEGKASIIEECWPDGESMKIGAPGWGKDFKDTKFSGRKDFKEFNKLTFVNVMSQVAARNMEKDHSVIVLGEEVANLGGGAYNATRYPLKYFPERVFNTPISEAGFTGIAFGASLCGCRPIVEIMFPDFALVAADQLFNQIAKLNYLYGGEVEVPLVVRTRIATGLGYGAQHSSDPGGLFAMFPGWRIVAPSNPFDYIGLFNTAMLSNDPVLIMEHHSLYREKGDVPKGNLDYFIEFGRAHIFRCGTDVTIITYLRGVTLIDSINKELECKGISIEGIDLRCIDYKSIDYESIGRSLKKTGKAIILEEASKCMGIGARLADEIGSRFFQLLKKPVYHINSIDVPFPVSRRLEGKIIVDKKVVKTEIEKFLKRS